MRKISWKHGFLSAELFDEEQRLVASLDRPLFSCGWNLDWRGERYLVRRPHLFSRDYRVTRSRTGEEVANIHLSRFFRKKGGRISLSAEKRDFQFTYTNFWKRHMRLNDEHGQDLGGTTGVSLFGWTGALEFREGVPELAVILVYFAYLRLAIRRRAARS